MDGLTFAREPDGTTTLRGLPADQAALRGLLSRMRDLGLPIVSMHRVCPDHEAKVVGEEEGAA